MIRRFAFRLEAVLRHRVRLEEVRERELAEIQAALVLEKQRLGDLLGLRADILQELAGRQEGALEVGDRALYQEYLDWLALEQERERRLIGDLEALHESKRQELVKASQEVKVVERLKERRLTEWRGEAGAAEQAQLDEIAGQGWLRALAPGSPLTPRGDG